MITDTTASAMFIVQDSVFRFANPVMETLTGYSREELGRIGLDKILHPNYHHQLERLREMGENTRAGTARMEFEIVRNLGETLWVDCSLRAIPYEGRPALLGTAFDITDRKHAEVRLLAYQEQLRSLASELSLTEERERRRMAGYLHDAIAQSLAFAKIKLETLMDTVVPSPHDEDLVEIHRFINQSIENTQSLTFDLSPPVLYELGFEQAVDWLCGQMMEQHRLTVSCRNDGLPKPLSDDVRIVLFNAIRELLSNVVKHSHARSAAVSIYRSGNSVQVLVEDDGTGFDARTITDRKAGKGGYGLFNIRERVIRTGGTLDINPKSGPGTHILITAPLSLP
jgi:PAS domain S-box-containing protein